MKPYSYGNLLTINRERIMTTMRNFQFFIGRFPLLVMVALAGMMLSCTPEMAQERPTSYITTQKGEGYFTLSSSGKAASIFVSSEDYPGVVRAAKDLQADVQRVSKAQPAVFTTDAPEAGEVVLIGTIGKSPVIDKLIADEKLDVSEIEGKWETYLIQVVNKPMEGVDKALVIAGSDKRGTIYGVYDVSGHIGVSPWYWWADVPVQHKPDLYVLPGAYSDGEPAVKYRGIFINDEAPALAGWVHENYGKFNHEFYAKVYELILRMKGNYLWPAMWGRAIYDDDSLNAPLAHEYGVVIGTSHHEPMMRAHVEWSRYGEGPWNYETNEETLREFWRTGIERMGENESIVTIGMRGDGDEPMTRGTAIALLERIVKDQRQIIEEVSGKKAEETPQMWALYKEVQDYYDEGMRVPDDVTLLLCDDNWGNIRKLPMLGEKPRKGGYGIYYHYDYVGGPRNYKWLNTTQIERVWEQMHLAHRYGANQVWIVNVGDIKPMEFPIEFFLDYAWNPDKWPAERLPEYSRLWAEKQFGKEYAADIAEILDLYTKYNSRRKPELLAPDTYSLIHYKEAETIVADYNRLAEKAQKINDALPEEYRDAYYQLVLFPVLACANLNEMYVATGKNRMYAAQGRAATNDMAAKVKELYARDAELTDYFHHEMADGKWNHMMSQTHIGYTYWQQPEENSMPEVQEIELPEAPEMGVAIEGSESWWPEADTQAILPGFDPFNNQSAYIEIFNRGIEPFDFTAQPGEPWVKLEPASGKVDKQTRLWVSVDWESAPEGAVSVPIKISGPGGEEVTVVAPVYNPGSVADKGVKGHVAGNGYVSMEAVNYSKAVGKGPVNWQLIPNLGRTRSAIMPVPVTAESQEPGGDSPRLEYTFHVFEGGEVDVSIFLSPTLNFQNGDGPRYAVSIDDAPPQVVSINADKSLRYWEKLVANNINVSTTKHTIDKPGTHTLKFWMVDPGVVLQKLVVDLGGVEPSYLGPPESAFHK